jgi:ATP-binding cassette, sub-family E, member 1
MLDYTQLSQLLQAIIKPQYVDHIPQAVRGNVKEILDQKNERNNVDKLLDEMDLRHVMVSQRVCDHATGTWS